MFKKPIYINYKHEIIVQAYLDLLETSVKELCGSDKNKLNAFIEVADVIIDHHNNYKAGTHEGNYSDFMSIIPTNFTAMVSGFLVGHENKENTRSVEIYRQILLDYAYRLVKDLETIKINNE